MSALDPESRGGLAPPGGWPSRNGAKPAVGAPVRRGARGTLRAVSGLLKTELPLAAGLCVFTGEVLALGRLPSPEQGILGFLVGFLLSGAAMISNDYFDLDVDRVNHPERPLPSKRITVRGVALLTVAFSIGGLAAAGVLGPPALLLAVPIWALGLLYNAKLKETGLPGNVSVSVSVASTFVLGGVVAGGLGSGLVWTFGGLAFLFDLGEEIASGVMDVKGDALRNAKSLARVHGRKAALSVTGGLFIAFIVLSVLPFLAGWMGVVALVLLLLADAAVAYLFLRLYRTKTPVEGRTRDSSTVPHDDAGHRRLPRERGGLSGRRRGRPIPFVSSDTSFMPRTRLQERASFRGSGSAPMARSAWIVVGIAVIIAGIALSVLLLPLGYSIGAVLIVAGAALVWYGFRRRAHGEGQTGGSPGGGPT